VDGQGQQVIASGLVVVPQKGAGASSPVLSYQHGTAFLDADAPSNHAVAVEPAVVMASQGYIVLAADYVGYGATHGLQHPYLLSAPTAAAVVDFIRASVSWMQANSIAHNNQLFLTGYSEGGYATMAAHRALQASNPTGLTPIASVPGAGPYDLGTALDVLLTDQIKAHSDLSGVNLHYLSLLPSSIRVEIRNLLMGQLLSNGSGSDISFQPTFLDNYLADNTVAVESQSNVFHWKPAIPVRLFHGQDDQTVPYASSVSTFNAMQALGADVTLTDCTVSPSYHTQCIPGYWSFMNTFFAGYAQGL